MLHLSRRYQTLYVIADEDQCICRLEDGNAGLAGTFVQQWNTLDPDIVRGLRYKEHRRQWSYGGLARQIRHPIVKLAGKDLIFDTEERITNAAMPVAREDSERIVSP